MRARTERTDVEWVDMENGIGDQLFAVLPPDVLDSAGNTTKHYERHVDSRITCDDCYEAHIPMQLRLIRLQVKAGERAALPAALEGSIDDPETLHQFHPLHHHHHDPVVGQRIGAPAPKPIDFLRR
jgi:hypothetical protein